MKPLRIQRLEIERERKQGVFWCVVGALWAALAIAWIFHDPSHVFGWLYLPLAASFVILGLIALRKTKRRLAKFAAEHGPDAGKQAPIR